MSELSPLGKELVRSGRHATDPTEADKERNLIALRSLVALGGASNGADQVQSLERATSLSLGSFISGTVVGGGLIATVFFFTGNNPGQSESTARESSTEVQEVRSSPLESSKMTPELEPVLEPQAATRTPAEHSPTLEKKTVGIASQVRPPSSSGNTGLGEEVALLSKATSALRSGRAQEALTFLSQHQKRFPHGALGRERSSARAQALCLLGRKNEAQAILDTLPSSSPLAERARRACKFEPSR